MVTGLWGVFKNFIAVVGGGAYEGGGVAMVDWIPGGRSYGI